MTPILYIIAQIRDQVNQSETNKKESKKTDNRDNLFKDLKELNEIVDLFDEKNNQDILQAMFEVTGHLGLHGAQIKVFIQSQPFLIFHAY